LLTKKLELKEEEISDYKQTIEEEKKRTADQVTEVEDLQEDIKDLNEKIAQATTENEQLKKNK